MNMQEPINTTAEVLSSKEQYIEYCEEHDLRLEEITEAEYYERLYQTAKES